MSGRRRAVVIGGSMSGLLAARVLAGHFAEVVLFDRDVFPASPECRRGVPQGQHAHALLMAGRQVLDGLFPGFREELLSQGALRGLYPKLRWFDNGVYHNTQFDGLEGLLVSRPRLEGHVRARLAAMPNLAIKANHDVDAPVFDGERVTGIRVSSRDGVLTTVDADLVVDASGRGSQSPIWLDRAGFPRPREEAVRVALGYTTRIYRRVPEHFNGDLAMICPSAPPQRRGGVALAMEGERWMVTLFGMLNDHPPTDAEGFQAFAGTIPAPDIHELIAKADPLTDPVPFKFPQSTRRHYEAVDRFPDGYLVFGDALCSFNPIYGQGMSSAAMQAAALEKCLAAGDAQLAARFFKAAAKVVDAPWTMAVGGDLRYAEVAGARSGMVKFVNWYIGKLHIAAATDPEVARAFHRVANLLDAPPSLMQPSIAFRILQGNLKRSSAPN
jgi:2-polyprenyl-6-methoxyphenol hydroxylase-like FAD-dependent oxidoreductase